MVMRMYKNIIIFIFCIAFSICNAQTTIAVIDFEANDVSESEVATLTDRFRNELVNTLKYIVIERGAVEEVLEEQGLQQSGCVSTDCAVEVGRMLGAEQILAGSIGKVGNVYTVSVRTIDVGSSVILYVSSYDHEGEIGGLLTIGMQNAVQQLISKASGESLKEGQSTAFNRVPNSAEERITGKVTDFNGNIYKTVKIGNQWWMAENLKVTQFRNGDEIPNVFNGKAWAGIDNSALCFYDNDMINADTYGALYNWFAVNDARKIEPEGWHIPSDEEWATLIEYLGGDKIGADQIKEPGDAHWISYTGGVNKSNFTALPGGYRYLDGSFFSLGYRACFWSSTESNDYFAFCVFLEEEVSHHSYSKKDGFSVRCVKD